MEIMGYHQVNYFKAVFYCIFEAAVNILYFEGTMKAFMEKASTEGLFLMVKTTPLPYSNLKVAPMDYF